jgi:hypothetical protein
MHASRVLRGALQRMQPILAQAVSFRRTTSERSGEAWTCRATAVAAAAPCLPMLDARARYELTAVGSPSSS